MNVTIGHGVKQTNKTTNANVGDNRNSNVRRITIIRQSRRRAINHQTGKCHGRPSNRIFSTIRKELLKRSSVITNTVKIANRGTGRTNARAFYYAKRNTRRRKVITRRTSIGLLNLRPLRGKHAKTVINPTSIMTNTTMTPATKRGIL